MASIPNRAIKKLVKRYTSANITDDGARELARILERQAGRISKNIVRMARKEKRSKITRRDVTRYLLRDGVE